MKNGPDVCLSTKLLLFDLFLVKRDDDDGGTTGCCTGKKCVDCCCCYTAIEERAARRCWLHKAPRMTAKQESTLLPLLHYLPHLPNHHHHFETMMIIILPKVSPFILMVILTKMDQIGGQILKVGHFVLDLYAHIYSLQECIFRHPFSSEVLML